jgi:hypothetical protein
MPVFRTAKLSLFREDRARAYEALAERSMNELSNIYHGHQCFGDVVREEGVAWQLLNRQPWFRENNPMMDNGGNLDFMAACMDEGISVVKIWNHVNTCNITQFHRELAAHGLHGIHFRMDVSSEADRIAYTCELANAIFQGTFSKTGSPDPISSLSLLTKELRLAIYKFIESIPMSNHGYEELSRDQIGALVSLDYKGNLDEEDQAFFTSSVAELLNLKVPLNGMTFTQLGQAIENAMVPLVYNFGYKLMADGAGILTTMKEAARRINVLVGFVPGSSEFCKALSRQMLINLFSAFPEGLKMLQAKPEELQGVMLNPVLIDDPLAEAFSMTLAGPVALFSQQTPTKPEMEEGILIKYLANAGYPVHLDTAINGYLANQSEMLFLACKSPGWSSAVDEKLQKNGKESQVNWRFAASLFKPDVLCQYSDQAVLNLIALSLDHEIREQSKYDAPVTAKDRRFPKGFASPAAILKDRPHLCEPVLEMLEQREWITPNIVEWCGFTHRELKVLGSRAPRALKSIVLESGLGL